MRQITIQGAELYDERTNRFITVKGTTLQLEHSLVSLSKWESKWKVHYLNNDELTPEMSIDYVRCMTTTQNVDPQIYSYLTESDMKIDVLLMDPPRTGSSEEFLNSVARIRPAKVVYISCNPETLVRDLKLLKKAGYRASRAVGVDMFPFTDATECCVLLERERR